jgi:hypothetical protein
MTGVQGGISRRGIANTLAAVWFCHIDSSEALNSERLENLFWVHIRL